MPKGSAPARARNRPKRFWLPHEFPQAETGFAFRGSPKNVASNIGTLALATPALGVSQGLIFINPITTKGKHR